MTQLEKNKKRQMHTVRRPVGEPLGKILCPRCGNSTHFVEQLESVLVSTVYRQNQDGSFTPVEQHSEAEGERIFLCGECGYDMTPFHEHFRDMSF